MAHSGPERPGGGPAARRSLIVALLIAAVVCVFWPVTHAEFTNFDDDQCVTDNPVVRRGLTADGLRWAFTAPEATRLTGWMPLTWLSHMADVQLFGVDAGAHHAVSLALHTANAVVLFLLLSGATGALWPAALVAALFAVHPLHVESVAWVAERKDVLSTLLWFLTTAAYLRHARRPGRRAYALVVALFALGLLAKPMLVTLPLTLLLLDWWPLARIPSRAGGVAALLRSGAVLEKLPLLALSAAISVVTLWAQARGRTLITLEALPVPARFTNALVSYASYLGKTLWPRGLAVHYPHPAGQEPLWAVAAAGALLVAVSALCVRERHRRPFLAVGWLWYLGTLVPVIGLVQVSMQGMTDRYTYVPLLGPFVMAAWALAGPSGLASGTRRRLGVPVAAAAAGALVALGAAAHRQTGYWHDSVSLARRALAVTAGNWIAHAALGNAYFTAGDVAGAEREFVAALRIQPAVPEVRNNLGNAYLVQGRFEEAAREYAAALALAPADPIARENLRRAQAARSGASGAAERLRRGNALYRQGRLEEALAEYRAAVALDASSADAHSNLGSALHALGRSAEAAVEFREAIRLAPGIAVYHYNLGAALARAGAPPEAAAAYREALRLDPGLEAARRGLGTLEGRQTP